MGLYVDKLEFHNLLKEYRDFNLKIEELELKIKDISDNTSSNLVIIYTDEIDELQDKVDKIYEKIGKRFLLIARNYINKPFYINYSDDWKDNMISEAVYDMVRYINNYNIDLMEERVQEGKIPDPFAYFSQYVYNGIMRFLGEKKKDKEFLVRLPFLENMDKGMYE